MGINAIFSDYYDLGYNMRSNLFQGQAKGQGWRLPGIVAGVFTFGVFTPSRTPMGSET